MITGWDAGVVAALVLGSMVWGYILARLSLRIEYLEDQQSGKVQQ